MAVKVTIQNGQFQDANGVAIVGTLVLQLTQDAVVSGTGQVAPKAISIAVVAGQAAATPVWGNDNLTPSGTVYVARLFDTSGALVWGPENWSITGAGPIEINTLVPSSSSVSYPAAGLLTGNNVFTGQNSFTAYNVENILFVDGLKYLTIDAAIAALSGSPGLVIVPSSYAGANATLPYSNVATVLDLRGGSTQIPARTDTFTTGDYVAFNSQVEGSIAGLVVQHGRTSPTLTSSAILATSKFTGTLPNAQTLAGLTAEVDIVGAVTPGTGVPCAIEAYTAIRSTSGTFADVRGLTASVNLDLAGSTTNITEASSIFASPPLNASGGSATISKAYSLQASQPTAGSTRNYAIFCNGSFLFPNNVNIDSITAGGTVQHIMTFGSGDLVQFRPLNDANGFQFADQGGTQRVVINSTGLGVVASPSFKLHVEGATAGDVLAKFKNTSGTGFGVKFVPGADANYAIAVFNAAESLNNFSVTGAGNLSTVTATVTGATPTGTGTNIGFGNTVGFGNGAAGTAVTTTLKNTGSGPTTPQTIVKYLQIDIGGTKFYVPLVQ